MGFFGHRRSALGGAVALALWLALGGGPGATTASAAAPAFSITSDNQQDLFVQAIATPDAVVHIAGNVDLDLTGRESLPVAPGVRILGDRTLRPQGPRLFTTSFPSLLLSVGNDGAGTHSDDVRISGIRLQGAESDDPFSAVGTSDSDGIRVDSSVNVEIDHSEIDHWRGAAVSIVDGQNRIGLQNARTVWVHDDYIHHNQHPTGTICCGHGAGYGVETSHGAYALVERNVFDDNRHAITGDGSAGDGYLAYRNLIWGGGGDNSYVWHTHEIDMHGSDSSCSYECGSAGEYMDVEYNTVWYTNGTGVKLRGTPSIGMTVSHNVFQHEDLWVGSILPLHAALDQTETGLHQSANTLDSYTGDQRKYCDFDGDGTDDAFIATGITWWYQSSALGGRWVYLDQSTTRLADVSLGDVDNDGLCDVGYPGGVFVNPGQGVSSTTATATVSSGDFDGDGRTDLALSASDTWQGLPVASSHGDGTFSTDQAASGDFPRLAATPGARTFTGDFDGDGRTDLAALGAQGWSTLPVAFSNGDGTFRDTRSGVGDFAAWASLPGVKAQVGDFDGDGRSDIALVGGRGWGSVPVAFSNGDGTFRVANASVDSFAGWAQVPGAQVVSGDFDHDGRTDLALVGGGGWGSVPVAFSNGDGTFRIANASSVDFAGWAAVPGARIEVGDVNGDGRTDIALVPGPDTPWWYTLPVAFSNGDGTFRVTNAPSADFAGWAQVPGAQVVSGDFDHDGRTDLALVGGGGWGSVPVAFSNGDGTFRVTNASSVDFAGWAAVPGVKARVGDFDGDGRTDIALVRGPDTPWWYTLPVAFSSGDGTFRITNAAADRFDRWASAPAHTPDPSSPDAQATSGT
ncbi:FG-GAP-like repeat-containing protein [Actinacidiphila rubida]|uniref:FG-GAP repeat-containing protein n=1 Tax=Actinacidiphila rubida TaxID=310780 RepID=A0A1H8PZ36_9ACTN|nr:FG-GAP-like repeat-containing protein [Actinacidiphila rubida]SEO47066.1 FG-GAP repeat-containing protein [Actinacidiphila rubida]